MNRFYYHRDIAGFVQDSASEIIGEMANSHEFALEEQQRNAWNEQISLLKGLLVGVAGHIILEFSIPRMGKRIDCVILSGGVIFAIEFKIGASSYPSHAIDQVTDYAMDLKNFHAESHHRNIIPILICTHAPDEYLAIEFHDDGIAKTVMSNGTSLAAIIAKGCDCVGVSAMDAAAWLNSGYTPTPTIIEAAQALYQGHSVEEISRSDAGAINLSKTSRAISRIIETSKKNGAKTICFLTGVPGAGKTLAGLNLANARQNSVEADHAVFLSGNGPLVEVLQEALARNDVEVERGNGNRVTKGSVLSKTKAFIQNIHHFRDEALRNSHPPHEHVVVFDEAQRAWTQKQTAAFMKAKKGMSTFAMSEPEFLISYLDRHADWATIVCLIGGGQEINTGEAGLHEWFDSLARSFPKWKIHISNNLSDSEYTQGRALFEGERKKTIQFEDDLHLSVSIRSFRSERVAAFVKAVLDSNVVYARTVCAEIQKTYPIVVTRNLEQAKVWLRKMARGTERYGLLASAGAMRLKPLGINVKCDIEPKNWFLNGRDDVRSSYFLEDAATEFGVQGLELDWTCVAWDADLRRDGNEWILKAFTGTRWHDVNDEFSRSYLKNAYRVLLTRARQGMVIFVPHGSDEDATRQRAFYDQTFDYLLSLGILELKNA